jgi:hypothetical protein
VTNPAATRAAIDHAARFPGVLACLAMLDSVIGVAV